MTQLLEASLTKSLVAIPSFHRRDEPVCPSIGFQVQAIFFASYMAFFSLMEGPISK